MDTESTSRPIDQPSEDGAPPPPSPDVAGEPPDLEPMTFSMLGRFFAVPLVIIATIVGGAVLVVLLFGGPASPERRSIEDLLLALEAGSGDRSLGVLLPREKELWQTALELSLRLEGKDKELELSNEELDAAAKRLSAMVKTDLGMIDHVPTVGDERERQVKIRSRRLEFLLRALGRTRRPIAVRTLTGVVGGERESYAQVAMQILGDLHEMPETRRAVDPVLRRLAPSNKDETRLVAATVLSLLASPGDERVIDALADLSRTTEGEVAWSAALALARLGSPAAKSTLYDLMDRAFLSSGDRYVVRGDGGSVQRYPMPPAKVDAVILAAIDAASNLDGPDLWDAIEGLESDPSPAVRGRAEEVRRRREEDQGAKARKKD